MSLVARALLVVVAHDENALILFSYEEGEINEEEEEEEEEEQQQLHEVSIQKT